MSKICSKCGVPLPDNARFCSDCGTPCAPIAQAQQPIPQPVQRPMQQPVQRPMQQPVQQPIQRQPQYNYARPNNAAPRPVYTPPQQQQQYPHALPNNMGPTPSYNAPQPPRPQQYPYAAPNNAPGYAAPAAPAPATVTPQSPEAPKKSKKKLIIILAIASAVVVAGVILLIVLLGGGEKGASSPESLFSTLEEQYNKGKLPTDIIYECVYAKDDDLSNTVNNQIDLSGDVTYAFTFKGTEAIPSDDKAELLPFINENFKDADKVEELLYAVVDYSTTSSEGTSHFTEYIPIVKVNGKWYIFFSPLILTASSSPY